MTDFPTMKPYQTNMVKFTVKIAVLSRSIRLINDHETYWTIQNCLVFNALDF